MQRTAIELLARLLEGAYRGDRWHALRGNLAGVRREEWDVRPARYRSDMFGPEADLSLADIVAHVGAAKRMYARRAFGDGKGRWDEFAPPVREMTAMLAWLDEGHQILADGLTALRDDPALAVRRPSHWGELIPVERFVTIMLSHDLYHAGEVNRQLSLLRGTSDWAWPSPDDR